MAYNSAYDLHDLMVNTKQATIYTAHENSLFLTGKIVPMIQLPAGSIVAQVPVFATGHAATKLYDETTNAATEDIPGTALTTSSVTISANIYAARTTLRDLGGIDTSETGRVLGNSIQTAFDTDVIAAMSGFTSSAVSVVSVDKLFDAAAQIRETGETGQLTCILSPTEAATLMKDVGSAAYAGGDFQTEGLRNGFLGMIAGMRVFQSSYVSGANKGYVFGEDALRIAMFKNVDLEVARRAEAVGNDIVASLHAGVGAIDATRGVKLLIA
jgi:hypothetical protein